MKKPFKILLKILPGKMLTILREVGREADRCGFQAYVAGGFVRDIILKKSNLDLDIVIEADAIRLAQEIASVRKVSLKTYQQFGTATLIFPEDLRVDMATARKETYPFPGALPEVHKGTIRDDLFRRDFTINAMAVRINTSRWEELVDEFNGWDDLKAKKIRVLHRESFRDDPTRILRAVRFEQRFGFHIEGETFRLLKDAIRRDAVKTVKPPRYFEEFKKILKEKRGMAKYIKRLSVIGGLDFLELASKVNRKTIQLMIEAESEIKWFQDKFPKKGKINSWLVYFITLISSSPLAETVKIINKFRFTREDRDKIHDFYAVSDKMKIFQKDKLRTREIYQICKPLSYEALIVLRATAKHQKLRKMTAEFLVKYDSVELNINGEDLRKLGMPPGQRMGHVLKELLYRKLEGRIHSRKDELKQAVLLIKK